jgi:hypothetical protein
MTYCSKWRPKLVRWVIDIRYFLTGIDEAKGTVADDVAATKPYYELGWEITSTHFDAKHLKKSGEIDFEHDSIVTCSGREFLYTSEFSRVVAYEDFRNIPLRRGDQVVSLMEKYAGGILPPDYFDRKHGPEARYRYFEEDREINTNLDILGATRTSHRQPYSCFVIRKRTHAEYRNFSDEMAAEILNRLAQSYGNIFIVGHDIERFHDFPHVSHVNLQTFAGLIQSEQCHLIVGSLTGPMHIAALVSKARVCLVVNHDGYDVVKENHPVLMGRCITYSKSRMLFVHPLQLPQVLDQFQL